MIKVLIAEDNAVNRELLRELLELRGYTVLEACDGQEALQMIEQTQPELLLLDIGMPVMDGFAVIRRIRENPQLAKLPVVAVTAYAMRGDQERILNSGFDGYLSKPVNPSSLAGELDRVLTKGSQPANLDQAHDGQPAQKAGAVGATGSVIPLGSTLTKVPFSPRRL
jgi:CheY-like chemotaxis protein